MNRWNGRKSGPAFAGLDGKVAKSSNYEAKIVDGLMFILKAFRSCLKQMLMPPRRTVSSGRFDGEPLQERRSSRCAQ
jgi:hypothetical protein